MSNDEVFNTIIDFIKKSKYTEKILIVNNFMLIRKHFKKNISSIRLSFDYDILQIGLDNYQINKKYDQIYSLVLFILNLKNINLIEFTWFTRKKFLNLIYSSDYPLFLHPSRYKKYYLLK